MEKLNLINVNPEYIDFLKQEPSLHNVLDHKHDTSKNGGRKYIGVLFNINDIDYFVPIHSGLKEIKNRKIEYLNKDNIRKIKRSKFDIYFISKDSCGNEKLKQVLKCAYMIPIPKSAQIKYEISLEQNDIARISFQKLYIWMNQKENYNDIINRAKTIYKNKNYYSTMTNSQLMSLNKEELQIYNYSKYWVDFKKAEQKCTEWEKSHSQKKN